MNTPLIAGTSLEPSRATAQSEKINANAKKSRGLEDQQPSAVQVKVQRLAEMRRDQVISKSGASRTDEDIVWSLEKSKEQVESKKCFVYGLKSSNDDHCRYIGQTRRQLKTRLKWHFGHASNLNNQSHANRWIRSEIRKGNEITIHMIDENAIWDETEIRFIKEYRKQYSDMVNISSGGKGGVLGVKRSETTKAKMRKPKSETTKAKMRKPKSDETKAKMSAAQVGNNKGLGEKNGNSKLNEKSVLEIKQRLKNNESLSSIAKSFGVTKGTIWKVKSGYSWSHVYNGLAQHNGRYSNRSYCLPC